jgi:exodeoxyribonuclease VII large subunit
MQGDGVEQSIISALNAIASDMDSWDIVVIIRGGGSTSDLSGFDTLALAENVAQFPLPIITGIGHERDDTVIDMVAHTRVKTPTAAAEYLIHHQARELAAVEEFAERIASLSML